VKNAVQRDGGDPAVMDLDPNKSVDFQMGPSRRRRQSTKKKKRVMRKKIYWNPINPEQVKEDSLWSIVKGRVQMQSLKYDVKEFEDLFTQSAEPADQKKKRASTAAKKAKRAVQVIDGKRSMNGGIILLRLKLDYKKIAQMVDKMYDSSLRVLYLLLLSTVLRNCFILTPHLFFFVRDHGRLDATQLKGLKEFLPTIDEKKGLLSYMDRAGTSEEAKKTAYAELSECEKYMLAMIDVADAAGKFDCMLFRVQFRHRLDEIVDSVQVVEKACEEVRSSEKLQQVMALILTLVNEINTGGDGNAAIGFSLDALLKLNEVSHRMYASVLTSRFT